MKNKLITKTFSFFALAALVGSSFAFAAVEDPAPSTVKVTITKYIGNQNATAQNASSTDFQMSATWAADNIGAGTGQYTLGASGATPYQAVTTDMSSGASYSTSEIMDSNTGASCDAGAKYALVGYTTGDTMSEAAAGTPTATSPSFVGLTTDKFVVVWNRDCSIPTSVKVQINKYVNGVQATAANASSTDFMMNATWTSNNFGSGTGQYSLSPNGFNGDPTPYQAKTVDFNPGSNYSTDEVTDNNVGANCAANKPFALVGYTTGDSMAEAASGTPSLVAPTFTNIMHDKSVIVWNQVCNSSVGTSTGTSTATSTGSGTIGGDVTGGQDATLHVTSIDTIKGTATADGTFTNGWKYVFHVTAPTAETRLSMKFSDWFSPSSSSTISVANNVRISSPQAIASTTVTITAADTYSFPEIILNSDTSTSTAGRQFDVTVEAAVPVNSVNGTYSTNYGIRTL